MQVTEYQFYRSTKDSDLYRYRYHTTDTPSLAMMNPLWRPWSTWLTREQIRKVIKERQKFKGLHEGLKNMKPGTMRRKKFIESSTLSRICYANMYPAPPTTSQQVLDSIYQALQETTRDEWSRSVKQLLVQLGVSKDKLVKMQEEAGLEKGVQDCAAEINTGLRQLQARGVQLLKDTPAQLKAPGVYQIGDKLVDISQGVCSCDSYQQVMSPFHLFCKHLYAAHLLEDQS